MPTVNLGRVQPIYQGDYSAVTTYEPQDYLTYNGNTYYCIADSTGNLPTDTNYFRKVIGVDLSSIPSAGALSYRNKIINGNFAVNQRDVTGTVTLSAGAYGHDRWKAGASGCTYTFATSANVTTITISAGSLVQVIEGTNLQSGTHVLSWTGTVQMKIDGGTAGDSGMTATLTGGTNATIETSGTGTVSLVQLERGTIVTPFEFLGYSGDLWRCLPYCVRWNGNASNPTVVSPSLHISTSNTQVAIPLPVPLVGTPSITESGLIIFYDNQLTPGSLYGSLYGAEAANLKCVSFLVAADAGAPMAQGEAGQVGLTSSATAFLEIDAEL